MPQLDGPHDDETPGDSEDVERLRRRSAAGAAHRAQQIEELKAQIKDVEQERRQLESIEIFAATLLEHTSGGRFCSALLHFRKSRKMPALISQFDESSARQLEAIEAWLIAEADRTVKALVNDLPPLLAEPPDPSSRLPRLTFRDGFVTAAVAKQKHEATISVRAGGRSRIPADPEVIAEQVGAEIQRCFGRLTDVEGFAKRLREAYLRTERGQREEPAPIRVVADAMEMGDRLDEFSVDLARLLTGDDRPEAAAGLHLDHTKDTDKGLLLPTLESRGYFGSVRFDSPHREEQ